MQTVFENGVLTVTLTGNVTGTNAPELETEIYEVLEQLHPDAVVIDCDGVEYMSSSGLRVILRVRQNVDQTSLIRVHPEFYEILETTGFTEMMEVQKAYRVVSVAGCELIGRGANGKIYRLDEENIIKVYTNTDSLPEIRHERELSRAAFVLGVPTAIPYDVVMIAEGGYGSIYELLNAKTYAYCGFGAVDHSVTKQFMGIDYETTVVLWRKILEGYLETKEESTLQSIEDKVKVISYARLMRHMIRENEVNTEAGRKQFAHYHAGLTELLPRIDTLQF